MLGFGNLSSGGAMGAPMAHMPMSMAMPMGTMGPMGLMPQAQPPMGAQHPHPPMPHQQHGMAAQPPPGHVPSFVTYGTGLAPPMPGHTAMPYSIGYPTSAYGSMPMNAQMASFGTAPNGRMPAKMGSVNNGISHAPMGGGVPVNGPSHPLSGANGGHSVGMASGMYDQSQLMYFPPQSPMFTYQ